MSFCTLIIPAAGIGKRMGEKIPKQFLPLAGKTVLEWTISFFENNEKIDEIIIAADKKSIDFIDEKIVKKNSFNKVTHIITGGEERQDSVYKSLTYVDDRADVILVHDAVRPFPPGEGIQQAIASALEGRGGVLSIPLSDTLKKVDEEGLVIRTVDRQGVHAIQTPQVFPAASLKMAFEKANREDFIATDEGMIMENAGFPVYTFPGNKTNIKITTRDDLLLAEVILSKGAEV